MCVLFSGSVDESDDMRVGVGASKGKLLGRLMPKFSGLSGNCKAFDVYAKSVNKMQQNLEIFS